MLDVNIGVNTYFDTKQINIKFCMSIIYKQNNL